MIEGNSGSSNRAVVEIAQASPEIWDTTIRKNGCSSRPVLRCDASCFYALGLEFAGNQIRDPETPLVDLRNSIVDVDGCYLTGNRTALADVLAVREGTTLRAVHWNVVENTSGGGSALHVVAGSTYYLDYGIIWANCTGDRPELLADEGSQVTLGTCIYDSSRVAPGPSVWLWGRKYYEDPRFCRLAGCDSSEASDYGPTEPSPFWPMGRRCRGAGEPFSP